MLYKIKPNRMEFVDTGQSSNIVQAAKPRKSHDSSLAVVIGGLQPSFHHIAA